MGLNTCLLKPKGFRDKALSVHLYFSMGTPLSKTWQINNSLFSPCDLLRTSLSLPSPSSPAKQSSGVVVMGAKCSTRGSSASHNFEGFACVITAFVAFLFLYISTYGREVEEVFSSLRPKPLCAFTRIKKHGLLAAWHLSGWEKTDRNA